MIIFYTKLKKTFYESFFANRIGGCSVVNVPFIIRPFDELQFGTVSLQALNSDWSVVF